jgi:tetratricopeptide (TPR) repeat protein
MFDFRRTNHMKRIFFLAVICLCTVAFAGCATTLQRGAMDLARSKISKGQYERALKELSYAEEYKEPTPVLRAEILYLRAICYEGLGRYKDAIGLLKYIIDKFPDSSYAYQAKERLRGIEHNRNKPDSGDALSRLHLQAGTASV